MKHSLQTKITGRGQTAIPVAVQEAIGAKPGLLLRWDVQANKTCNVSVIGDGEPKSAKEMLGFARTFRKPRKTAAWLKELGGEL